MFLLKSTVITHLNEWIRLHPSYMMCCTLLFIALLVVALIALFGLMSSMKKVKFDYNNEREKVTSLKIENISINRALSNVQKSIRSLRTNIQSLTEELSVKDFLIFELNTSIEEQSNEIIELNNQIRTTQENTKKEKARLQTINNNYEQKIYSLENQIEKLNAAIQEKSQQLAQLANDKAELKTQVVGLQRSVNDYNASSIKTKETLEQKKALIEEQRCEIQKLQERLNQQILENENVLNDKEGIILDLQSNLQKLKSVASNQSSQIELLTRQSEHYNALYIQEREAKDEEKKELERQNQALEEQIHDLKREAEILENDLQTKNQSVYSIGEELSKTRSNIADLKEQLNKKESRLSQQESEITALKAALKDEQSKTAQLEAELENLKKQLDEEKQKSHVESPKQDNIKEQEEPPITQDGIAEHESKEGETETKDSAGNVPSQGTGNQVESASRRKSGRPSKSKEEEAIELSKKTIENFPPITNDSKKDVKRSIEYVYDSQKEKTYADEFFRRSAEEIAQVSRKLAEAKIAGETEYVCGMCRKPVIVAHRTINGKESLFFAHAKRGESYCPWIHISTSSKDDAYLFADGDEDVNNEVMEKSKGRLMKEKIFSLLTTDTSKDLGITDVKMDTIIRSTIPYMKWRRPDLSFRYNGKNVVILLQRKSHDLNTIVDRDVFFRLNNMYVVWVFGADSDTSYDYMRSSNYKNTLFANHRNVFVFDLEAQEKSEENGSLMLKCNWLDENDEWSINLSKDQKNGQILSLEDLTYEEDSFKPYYVDANKTYFGKHPETLEQYLQSHHTREELLKMFEDKWLQDPSYEESQQQMHERKMKASPFPYLNLNLWGFRFNSVILIQPVFTEEPKDLGNGYFMVRQNEYVGLVDYYGQKVLDWSGILKCDSLDIDAPNNRIYFSIDSLKGVADITGHVLIEPRFDHIANWTANIYRVMRDHKWGLCDINGNMIVECIYESIGELTNGHATAVIADREHSWKNYSGSIDEMGNPISKLSLLDNGFNLVEQFERKGISDKDNNIIIPIEYEEILSWTSDACRVKKNGKWGVVRLSDKGFILPIKYDSIEALDGNGRAKAVYVGVESFVNAEGQTVAQVEVQLLDGLKKTKVSGKWGIVDAGGNEIVQHKYDEIGAFRQRLIGIINGRVIKLDAYYDYQIQVTGKCVKHQGKSSIIVVGGVTCVIPDAIAKQRDIIIHVGKTYEDLAFGNLMFGQKNYQLKIVPNDRLNKRATHGDKPNDFSDMEIVTGVVSSFKIKKDKRNLATIITKLLVKVTDGRETMVPRRFFKSANLDITDWKVGDAITLQKTGFDDELDQTIWKIIVKQ